MADFKDFLRTLKFAVESFRGHWPDQNVTRQWLDAFDKFSRFEDVSDQALQRLEETLEQFWLEGHEEATRIQLLRIVAAERAKRQSGT